MHIYILEMVLQTLCIELLLQIIQVSKNKFKETIRIYKIIEKVMFRNSKTKICIMVESAGIMIDAKMTKITKNESLVQLKNL